MSALAVAEYRFAKGERYIREACLEKDNETYNAGRVECLEAIHELLLLDKSDLATSFAKKLKSFDDIPWGRR